MHNPFNIGVDRPSIDDVTEYRLYLMDKKMRWPQRIEEYWHVRDRNLALDADSLEERIARAYNSSDTVHLRWGWFVTDDTDLFVEMYRHLKIDFVIDFASGLFFIDLFGGHEGLMTQLFDLSGKHKPPGVDDEGEAYVRLGLGVYKSSQSPTIHIGADVVVPDYLRPFKHRLERME